MLPSAVLIILFSCIEDIALYKPTSEKKEEKCQLFHSIPSIHSVDNKNQKQTKMGRFLLVFMASDPSHFK